MQNPYRQVLHSHFIMGLTISEITKITGGASNGVSIRISRGLRQLRSALPASYR